MATASEKLESTSERENYQRLHRLIMAGCTALLRDLFDSIIPPSRLAADLAKNEKYLKKNAGLTRVQFETLYPPSGNAVTSDDFDITLLLRLLRHICNLNEPTTGWDKLPEVDNYAVEAELARVKFYRNTILHMTDTKITEADFQSLWQEITAAMLALAKKLKKEKEWREAINKLSVDSLTVKDGSIEELKDVMKSAVSRFESKVDTSLLQLKMCFQPEEKRTSEDAAKTATDEQSFYDACREGKLCRIKAFVESSGKTSQRAVWIGTQLAASFGHKDIMEFLLDIGGNKNFTDENGWTILHHAAKGGNSELVRTLLDRYRRMKVDSKSTSNLTPLHIAAQHSKAQVIDVLLSKDADVMAVDDSGMNALHFASQGGDIKTIEKFVLNKRFYKDPFGGAPPSYEDLMKAAPIGKHDAMAPNVVHDTMAPNGNSDAKASNCEEERKTVRSASLLGHVNKVQKVSSLIDVNSKTSKGLTPLHIAARNGNVDAVNFLLNEGADKTEVADNKWTVLHYAAQGGNTEIIDSLLKMKISVNSRSGNECTPLHVSALNGHLDAVKLLINNGADTKAVTKNNWTVLHFACKGWSTEVIQRLLDQPMDINCRNSEGSTPVHIAALNGNLKALNILIANGGDITDVTKKSWTVLHCAAQRGSLDTIERLLEVSVQINCVNDDGSTPLHIAALNGNLDAVNCLLNNDADKAAISKNGWTVLHYATYSGNTATIERLLELSVDINCQDSDGSTPLHIAALNGNLNTVNFLLEHGADKTVLNNNGWSVLHSSARSGNTATIERLLELKIDANCRNKQGLTPLHIASKNGNLDALNVLVNVSADLAAVTKNGWTVLHFAAYSGKTATIERVLEFPVDINSRNGDDCTPLDIATFKNNLDAVNFLIERGAFGAPCN